MRVAPRRASVVTALVFGASMLVGGVGVADAYTVPAAPSYSYYVSSTWGNTVSFNGHYVLYAYQLGYQSRFGSSTTGNPKLILDFRRQKQNSSGTWGVGVGPTGFGSDAWVTNVTNAFVSGVNYTSWTPSLAHSVMGTYVLNAMDPEAIAFDGTFLPARALGRLQIVGATTTSVTFTSSVGVTGSFDFVNHTWTFDP